MSRVTHRARQIKGGSSACSKQQPSSLSQRSGDDVISAVDDSTSAPTFSFSPKRSDAEEISTNNIGGGNWCRKGGTMCVVCGLKPVSAMGSSKGGVCTHACAQKLGAQKISFGAMPADMPAEDDELPPPLVDYSGNVFGAMPTFDGVVPAFGGCGSATFGVGQMAEPSPQFLRVNGAGNSMVDGIYTLAGTHKNVNKWYE